MNGYNIFGVRYGPFRFALAPKHKDEANELEVTNIFTRELHKVEK